LKEKIDARIYYTVEGDFCQCLHWNGLPLGVRYIIKGKKTGVVGLLNSMLFKEGKMDKPSVLYFLEKAIEYKTVSKLELVEWLNGKGVK